MEGVAAVGFVEEVVEVDLGVVDVVDLVGVVVEGLEEDEEEDGGVVEGVGLEEVVAQVGVEGEVDVGYAEIQSEEGRKGRKSFSLFHDSAADLVLIRKGVLWSLAVCL